MAAMRPHLPTLALPATPPGRTPRRAGHADRRARTGLTGPDPSAHPNPPLTLRHANISTGNRTCSTRPAAVLARGLPRRSATVAAAARSQGRPPAHWPAASGRRQQGSQTLTQAAGRQGPALYTTAAQRGRGRPQQNQPTAASRTRQIRGERSRRSDAASTPPSNSPAGSRTCPALCPSQPSYPYRPRPRPSGFRRQPR
jgi:hypothetical protein